MVIGGNSRRFKRRRARRLPAVADLAGEVALLSIGRIELADAPVEPRRDRFLEPVRERLPADVVVAADVAGHVIVGLTIDLGLEKSRA
jgi:hypothetical protein